VQDCDTDAQKSLVEWGDQGPNNKKVQGNQTSHRDSLLKADRRRSTNLAAVFLIRAITLFIFAI
jgi:hypothetical protein